MVELIWMYDVGGQRVTGIKRIYVYILAYISVKGGEIELTLVCD